MTERIASSMARARVLTGITTTGTPHLGNLAGALQPAIDASRQEGADAFFFLADLHALIKCDDPGRIERSRLEITATWLACGLDPHKTTFYRQSDIPEIPQASWLLSCVAAKGLLNRAHAYKAAVAVNVDGAADADAGISMGLFSYPVLMAADILLFDAKRVPVGCDQIQHVEMARDIGQRFNHLFGGADDFFELPEAVVREDVAVLPGLDGRKMSKSYDNTIPLFLSQERLRDSVNRIITDSRAPGEPKNPDESHLFALYHAFAPAQLAEQMRADLLLGLGWGEAKRRLALLLEDTLGPARERYHVLLQRPDDLEDILVMGAVKARMIATPKLERLRQAVGLRSFASAGQQSQAPAKAQQPKLSQRLLTFKDGESEFRFRLIDGLGETLLLSRAFADGAEAGRAGQRLLNQTQPDLRTDAGRVSAWLDDEVVAHSAGVSDTEVMKARIIDVWGHMS